MKKILIGALLLFSLVACKKNIKEITDASTKDLKPALALRQTRFSDYPRVTNGVLTFRDAAHLNAYSDFLSESILFDETDTDPVEKDPDEILQAIESSMSFTSLRNVTNARFEALNEVGWATLEEIPEKHFINDLATKSMLNANADLRVGNYITHYVNKDWAVTVSVNDVDVLSQLHGLPLSATFEDISILYSEAVKGDLTIHPLSSVDVLEDATKSTVFPYHLNGPTFLSPDPCNEPKKIKMTGLNMSVLDNIGSPTPVQAYYEVQWGDGTTSTYTSNSGINYAWLYDVWHTYPSQSTYTVHIKGRDVTNTSSNWDVDETFTINVPNGCNWGHNRTSSTYWHNNGYGKAWTGKNWVENYMNLWNNPRHKTGARTEAFEWNGNVWKLYKAVSVVAQYWITKYAPDCNGNWGGSGATWNTNSKSAEASHTNDNQIGWFKIVSNHRITAGGTVYAFDLETNACQ